MKKNIGYFCGAVFLCLALVLGPSAVFAGGEYGHDNYIITGGDVMIGAGQYQEYFFGLTGNNSAYTSGDAMQTITASGYGNCLTSVMAEAQLAQYEPYQVELQMPLGQAEHYGESYMGVYGIAGTDPWMHSLGIDIMSGRDFTTNTAMTENSMDSSIIADTYLDAHVGGAVGTVGFAAVNEQVTGYSQERGDGAWQQGMTKTTIRTGTLPQ